MTLYVTYNRDTLYFCHLVQYIGVINFYACLLRGLYFKIN